MINFATYCEVIQSPAVEQTVGNRLKLVYWFLDAMTKPNQIFTLPFCYTLEPVKSFRRLMD